MSFPEFVAGLQINSPRPARGFSFRSVSAYCRLAKRFDRLPEGDVLCQTQRLSRRG